MKDLSIIIVNWNTRELLRQCIDSIEATTSTFTCDIIVVDNASSDGSVEMVRTCFPHINLIANAANVGFACVNNQGIEVSFSRYVMLLNSDTIVRPDAFRQLVAFLDDNQSAGMVGPELLNGDGTVQLSWAAFPTLWSELRGVNVRARQVFAAARQAEAYSVDWLGGACLVVRRATIEQVGLLDERFFMYCEETDWCFRARQHGWEVVYYPAAQVTHLGGQSSRQASAQMKAQLYRSKLFFMAKHYGWVPALVFRLVLQSVFLARALCSWLLATLRIGSRADALVRYTESLIVVRRIRFSPYHDYSYGHDDRI